MTKVYRVELMIVDHDGLGATGVRSVLENGHHPNHCIRPVVMEIEERAVDWSDAHPLNQPGYETAFRRLFGRIRAAEPAVIGMTVRDLIAAVQLAGPAPGDEVILRIVDDEGSMMIGGLARVTATTGCTDTMALVLDASMDEMEE